MEEKGKIEVPVTLTGNSELDRGLESLPNMSNKDALDVALVLQQIIRGQDSILENMDKFSTELSHLKEKMAKMDAAAEKFEFDRNKFIEDVNSKADSLRATGDQKDKIIANGVIEAQRQINLARANLSLDRAKFEASIKAERKIKVISPGKYETRIVGGQQTAVIVPEVIRLFHMQWILPPGVEVEVPESVAKRISDIRVSSIETQRRQESLQKNLDQDALVLETDRINKEFKSSALLPGQSE